MIPALLISPCRAVSLLKKVEYLCHFTGHIPCYGYEDIPFQLPSCLDNRLKISKVEFQEKDLSSWTP